jgi:Cbb3-type cytochrome oxidase, cytochrome c subunit
MADKIYSTKLQDTAERNVFVMFVLLMVLLSVGGLVEIVPLFYLDETMEHNKHPEIVWQYDVPLDQRKPISVANFQVGDSITWKPGDGIRPYTALELAGRDVYQREGCYLCHSQMIRPSVTRRSVTATTRWLPSPCTTTLSSGAPSGPAPTWPGWVASTPTSGTSST